MATDETSTETVTTQSDTSKTAKVHTATASLLPASWSVMLPEFEGPLDLLLQLIKINEVDITDIPLVVVCDQFHAYLDLMEALDLDIAGEYIYMAAYLIHLKSKMLLPRPKTNGDGEAAEDPRDELVERLLEYRRLKEAAQTLAEVDSVRRGMWVRESDELARIVKADLPAIELADLSMVDLLRTFKTVLDRFEEQRPEPMQVVGETFSVRDQMTRLLERMRAARPLDLLDDLRTLSGRREAIAAFLAVLELSRLALIRIHVGERGIVLYRTAREIVTSEIDAVQG
ncbi:MAG: segregation/condensation protein A [Acidobacteriota bacterium]